MAPGHGSAGQGTPRGIGVLVIRPLDGRLGFYGVVFPFGGLNRCQHRKHVLGFSHVMHTDDAGTVLCRKHRRGCRA